MPSAKLVPIFNNNEATYVSESGSARWNMFLRGTGLNNNAPPVITRNGTNVLSGYGRGLTLVIFDTNMNVLSTTVYDIYAVEADKNNLAAALTGLAANRFFALVSYDAISTNATLDSAMTTMGSTLWNTKYLNIRNTTGAVRCPYAAFGNQALGIVSEQVWSDGASDPYAQFTVSVEDYSTLGNTGYGPVVSYVEERSGNTYPFFSTGNIKPTLNPKVNEYIRVTMDVKVDKAAYDAGVGSSPYINDSIWTWSTSTNISSLEYQRTELLIQFTGQADIIVSVYHMPSNITTGLAYCKNVQVQRVGFNPTPSTARSKIGPEVITSRNVAEAPHSFRANTPSTYLNLWNSDRNLYRNLNTYTDTLNGSNTNIENVRWFDTTLTSNLQKIVHQKTVTTAVGENMAVETGAYVNVNPTKMYYGAIWYYNFEKTNGRIYVGCYTRNSSDSQISTRDAFGSTAEGLNPYFVYPTGANIEKNKWNIVDCWFLPHTMSQAEATDFHNKYWQKTHGYYNNRLPNEGNCQTVWMTSDVAKVTLRWLDFYNGTATTKTWWALPMLVEVSPLTFQNYEMSSWHLKEV